MAPPIVKRYGDHWERVKLFTVKNGRVERAIKGSPLDDAKGLYVLYRGENPIYVGIALGGDNTIMKRLQDHAKNWLAPWWDSVCWYDFGENTAAAQLIESFMISHGVGLWNGAESAGEHFGEHIYLEGSSFACNDLWRNRKA